MFSSTRLSLAGSAERNVTTVGQAQLHRAASTRRNVSMSASSTRLGFQPSSTREVSARGPFMPETNSMTSLFESLRGVLKHDDITQECPVHPQPAIFREET
jgi:hypothetical protein